jgi:hypothetical protein
MLSEEQKVGKNAYILHIHQILTDQVTGMLNNLLSKGNCWWDSCEE